MTRYLIRQSLLSLIKLFLFLTVMFFLIQIIMPGDYVDQFTLQLNRAQRDALRDKFGLGLPIWERYLRWLGKIARLDLGLTFSNVPVVDVLEVIIPPTLLVFFTGTALAFLIGLWLGKRTAWRGPGLVSGVTTLGGLTLFTSFPPWLAWLMTYYFTRGGDFVISGSLGGISRTIAFKGLDRQVWTGVETPPYVITFHMFLTLVGAAIVVVVANGLLRRFTRRGLPGIVALLLTAVATVGSWYALQMEALAFDILSISWLATLTYTLLSFGETMLIMQSSMADVLQEEYITTARAKGLPASTVREKHAARNAILPVLSRLVISLPYLLTGIVIIESSLGWPGMGTTLWNSLYWQDMPLVMDVLLIVGVLSLVARLVLDVLIAYLDPRIRYGQRDPSLV